MAAFCQGGCVFLSLLLSSAESKKPAYASEKYLNLDHV